MRSASKLMGDKKRHILILLMPTVDMKDLSLFSQAYNKKVVDNPVYCPDCCEILDETDCQDQQPFVPATNPTLAQQCCKTWGADPSRYLLFRDVNADPGLCIIDKKVCPDEEPFDIESDTVKAKRCCMTPQMDPSRYVTLSDLDTNSDNLININDIAQLKPLYMTGWGPNVKPDVKVHTNNGMSRVDWNKDGKVTINDLALMKGGRVRCTKLANDFPPTCTVCYDVVHEGTQPCPALPNP